MNAKTTRLEEPVLEELRANVRTWKGQGATRKEIVARIASELFLQHSVYPSANGIYAIVQRGSMTDIHRDLTEWWAWIRGRLGTAPAIDALPAEVQTVASDALAGIWKSACALAAKQADEARTAHEALVHVERENTARAQADAERWRIAANEAKELANTLKEKLDTERLLVASKQAQIDTLQVQLSESLGDKQRMQAQFSADLAAERQARVDSENYLRGETTFALRQIDEARQSARAIEERLREERQRYLSVETTLRTALSQAKDELANVKIEAAECRGKLEGLSKPGTKKK